MTWPISIPTFTAGEVVTAAKLTALRDALAELGDPWSAWTPTWTAATSNPTLGNGALTGAYLQAGKRVEFWVQVVMGSTTTYGTGAWLLDLPVAESAHRWGFQGTARDVSAGLTYPIAGTREASGQVNLRAWPTSAGIRYDAVTSAVPFTWANGDELFISGTYEAA